MLALKPGLFPLPALRRLLFPHSAFHSGFNSLQTLFLMDFSHGGPPARSGTTLLSKKKFHAPLGHKKGGGSCSHTSPSLTPCARKAGGQHPASPLWGCVPRTRSIPSHQGSWRCPRCPCGRAGAPKGPSPNPAGGVPRGHGEGRWEAAVVCTAIQRWWHASARPGSLFPLFFTHF